MKYSLEKQLATALPVAKTTEQYHDFESMVKFYFEDLGAKPDLETFTKKMKPDVTSLASSWPTLCFLLGLTIRMSEEGRDPYKFLGCTPEEKSAIIGATKLLRSKITAAPRTSSAKQSETKRLYDQIVARGF